MISGDRGIAEDRSQEKRMSRVVGSALSKGLRRAALCLFTPLLSWTAGDRIHSSELVLVRILTLVILQGLINGNFDPLRRKEMIRDIPKYVQKVRAQDTTGEDSN